ncbi:alkaline phosphatase family protein [Candidatus Desulfovibrio trichonymphae]|uniref:Type I phosphodiesterase/nucleotide pyrophosphatase n=1 Tax=Candidatus Desulfovibrio trichonymphae TaxID=1725232 RepID=A0A1J1DX35_9BACT|nr:alkaline phosphatase family protein [Candidatus Desulfovibrio trichonymphae]BAV91654.1 conserved hypothetical protein [Candidatus Desulfovibrio trichonymphae]GHU91084.1 hypothetical protein AGMMS49925_05040 [Deltaproteobacteria bacterium]GHU94973.1 hypothetical protein AGMMS49974_05470 [Deltaproteobacteria bacterium]
MNRHLMIILLDGLRAATARRCFSYVRSLERAGAAGYVELTAELPPFSRPIYATLLSGHAPVLTGIVHNDDARLCPTPTIFHLAQKNGLVTAAAAYCWISELCNAAPFVAGQHRLTNDVTLPIAHGLFYSSDAYPDDELFHDAEWLRLQYQPHILLVHSMGIDHAGHMHGADSPAYRDAARNADALLARFLPHWLDAGYAALITSDHGMDNDRRHCDVTEQARRVPLWLVGQDWEERALPKTQTQIAGMVQQMFGIDSLLSGGEVRCTV